MCEKFRQLLAVGRWFPPGTPVSSTRKLISSSSSPSSSSSSSSSASPSSSSSSSSSFHRLVISLAVAEAYPNKPNYQLQHTAPHRCNGTRICIQVTTQANQSCVAFGSFRSPIHHLQRGISIPWHFDLAGLSLFASWNVTVRLGLLGGPD